MLERQGALLKYAGRHVWLLTPDQSIEVLDLAAPERPRYAALPTDVAVYPRASVDDWDIYENNVRVLALQNTFLVSNGMMLSSLL